MSAICSSSLIPILSRTRFVDSFRTFNFLPTTLALLTSFTILCYISLTSNLFHYHYHKPIVLKSELESLKIPEIIVGSSRIPPFNRKIDVASSKIPAVPVNSSKVQSIMPEIELQTSKIPQSNLKNSITSRSPFIGNGSIETGDTGLSPDSDDKKKLSRGENRRIHDTGNGINSKVFHNKKIFMEYYKEMNKSFKIYVYPHKPNDPFANMLLPVDSEPGGNYASESYFKKVLMQSHFITKNPAKADLFFLPFSIARLRHDPRVDVGGIKDFVRMYITNISRDYPYWNRTGGADHFYVACHSAGRSAMEKTSELKYNAIQVACSSSYFLSGYVTHKDASLPQIWPRHGNPPEVASLKREKLAFFAGAINSPVRQKLLQEWRNDSEIFVHFGHLATPYADALLSSKFCLHVKGFEVNTARIADALFYGCVPIVIANHYDLPFADILDWKSFSLVVATLDIPLLREILHGVSNTEYEKLQRNVLKVRRHFRWHVIPVDYDAFYMVMYELWLRRAVARIPLQESGDALAGDRNITKCI